MVEDFRVVTISKWFATAGAPAKHWIRTAGRISCSAGFFQRQRRAHLIEHRTDQPPTIVMCSDMSHLPAETAMNRIPRHRTTLSPVQNGGMSTTNQVGATTPRLLLPCPPRVQQRPRCS